jgi:iron complex transport system substrate-binding protein
MAKGLLLSLVLSLALTACSGSRPTAKDEPKTVEPGAQVTTTRKVTHQLGTIEVPEKPARVVVLDTGELDIALGLGVKPVGAVIADAESGYPDYLKEKAADIKLVGTIQQPNLEAIAALKPDLILTNVIRHEKIYGQLSQIAPTVMGKSPNLWKENLKLYAEALGKQAEAEKFFADYTKRLDEFKQQMGDRLSKTKVSLVRSMPDHVRMYENDSFSGSIIRDAGLPRPQSQDKAAVHEKVAEERIPELDGDVIFLFYYGRQKGDSLAKFFQNPLWNQLSAVKQKQVFEVSDGHWGLGLGPIAANLVLDDLFKYLAK